MALVLHHLTYRRLAAGVRADEQGKFANPPQCVGEIEFQGVASASQVSKVLDLYFGKLHDKGP